MWRALVAGIIGAGLLVGSVAAQDTPPLRYDPTDLTDRNCADFDSWEEAQAFYLAAGGPATRGHARS